MCESYERNQRALHAIKTMTGTWTIDLGQLRQILTGNECDDHEQDKTAWLQSR